ncbi:MAG TPA: hypothetical protein VJA94_22455 [Candidatus Angelobacter sp.]
MATSPNLAPPSEWPTFQHPEDLFTIRLPRGWEKIEPLSPDATFAAKSPGGRVLLEIIVGESRWKPGFEIVEEMPKVMLEAVRESHNDVRDVWHGEVGRTPTTAIHRLIVDHSDKAQISGRIQSSLFATDYFFLGGGRRIVFVNFKLLAFEYPCWAGLFERIVRGVQVAGFGELEVSPSCPMAALQKPAGWMTSYFDPISFAYPPDWQEATGELGGKTIFALVGPQQERLEATIIAGEDFSFERLMALPSDFAEDLQEVDLAARLIWEGEGQPAQSGRSIRVIVELPTRRPPAIADIVVMGDAHRSLMLHMTAPRKGYAERAAILESMARTAVVGAVSSFDIARPPPSATAIL